MGRSIQLFLCGDVMIGRGIDQILSHPGDPTLYESSVRDARQYVGLAESMHGPIPRSASGDYVWGDARGELRQAAPDLRIVNLETSLTRSDAACPGKPVLYRADPANVDCLRSVGIDCCGLANNHVLDWGEAGLVETLDTLDGAGIPHAGAGRSSAEARRPAVLWAGCTRVLVFALGATSSGVPAAWAATATRPGVRLLPDLSELTAGRVAGEIAGSKRAGDVAIVSIHWGGNWGYQIPTEHVRFAHRLIELGVDVVHGHSSHHVLPLELYRGHLILYGCGDFITDYEGIAGYEQFRGDLAVMYLIRIDPRGGQCVSARLVPFQSRQFRLRRASPADAQWLEHRLNLHAAERGATVQLAADNTLFVSSPVAHRMEA